MLNFFKNLFKREIKLEVLDCTACSIMPQVEFVERIFLNNKIKFKLVKINKELWDFWLSNLNEEYKERFRKEKKIVDKYIYEEEEKQ